MPTDDLAARAERMEKELRALPYGDMMQNTGLSAADLIRELRVEREAMLVVGPTDANPKLAYSDSGDIDRCASVCLLNARAAENAHVSLTQMRLAATLLSLVRERDELRAGLPKFANDLPSSVLLEEAVKIELGELRAENDALRADFEKYAAHSPGCCADVDPVKYPCSCGLDEAREKRRKP